MAVSLGSGLARKFLLNDRLIEGPGLALHLLPATDSVTVST